ncbi:response regulator transcription factor [Micromonospora sp. NPDC050980]|uniref:response regulator transcription factor n=1 Tax=Micromonospora sp. NPDC050980 TaxID=3155161 RepID=UPI0033F98C2F
MDQDPTRLVLVDDHMLVREGIRGILEVEPDLTVVGEAGDSASAVAVVAELRPHVVLLDVEIIGDDVVTTIQRMREVAPESQILILSMYDGPHLLQRLLGLGIRGYLLKSARREELVSAVRAVRRQDDRIILGVSRQSLARIRAAPADPGLSAREIDVLELAAQALTNAQIASRLQVTEATVKRHLSNIFAKLGAVSRIDAVNKALLAELISAPRPGGHGEGGRHP